MAISNDFQLQYSLGDEELTQSNATIMPSGTSSYTVAEGHVAVIARKTGNTIRFTSVKADIGNSVTVGVEPGDAVWDKEGNYFYMKFSTGGNDFVNMVNDIPTAAYYEDDQPQKFIWNGLLSI